MYFSILFHRYKKKYSIIFGWTIESVIILNEKRMESILFFWRKIEDNWFCEKNMLIWRILLSLSNGKLQQFVKPVFYVHKISQKLSCRLNSTFVSLIRVTKLIRRYFRESFLILRCFCFTFWLKKVLQKLFLSHFTYKLIYKFKYISSKR